MITCDWSMWLSINVQDKTLFNRNNILYQNNLDGNVIFKNF